MILNSFLRILFRGFVLVTQCLPLFLSISSCCCLVFFSTSQSHVPKYSDHPFLAAFLSLLRTNWVVQSQSLHIRSTSPNLIWHFDEGGRLASTASTLQHNSTSPAAAARLLFSKFCQPQAPGTEGPCSLYSRSCFRMLTRGFSWLQCFMFGGSNSLCWLVFLLPFCISPEQNLPVQKPTCWSLPQQEPTLLCRSI